MRTEEVMEIAVQCGFQYGKDNSNGESILIAPENEYDLTKLMMKLAKRIEVHATWFAMEQAKKFAINRASKTGDLADLISRDINTAQSKLR